MTSSWQTITSRDNPVIKSLKKIAHHTAMARQQGKIWLEGDHLIGAALAAGLSAEIVVANNQWDAREHCMLASAKHIEVSPGLMKELSTLESPPQVAAVFLCPIGKELDAQALTVVLDGVQDSGNVGSILRSSAAFGIKQIIALQGTAALWSNKVVRSAMGAHFSLNLIEKADAEYLKKLAVPIVCTSSHEGVPLPALTCTGPVALVFGNEGSGVSEVVLALTKMRAVIPQPGGQESLNVAAAAAVCLYQISLFLGHPKS